MHVWIRRQEIEIEKTRVLAQGLLNPEGVQETFKTYIETVLPFYKISRRKEDEKMVAAMKKEMKKGRIEFTLANETNILKKKAKELQAPDEYKQQLINAVKRKKAK